MSAPNQLPAPLLSVQEALDRRKRLEELIDQYLVEGIDYDVPKRGGNDDGEDSKKEKKGRKSLLKPGAEKLNDIFGFASRARTTQRVIEWSQPVPFILFEVEVDIVDSTGRVIATRSGVCSTAELKYRYNWIKWWKVQELGLDPASLTQKTISPKGQKSYTLYRIDNPSINDLANTIAAMATKRAFISATKSATATTGIFDEMDEDAQEEAQVDGQTGQPTAQGPTVQPQLDKPKPIQEPPGGAPQDPPGAQVATTASTQEIPSATDRPAEAPQPDHNKCAVCGAEVTKAAKEYSTRNFGQTLCRNHQPQKGGGQQ